MQQYRIPNLFIYLFRLLKVVVNVLPKTSFLRFWLLFDLPYFLLPTKKTWYNGSIQFLWFFGIKGVACDLLFE